MFIDYSMVYGLQTNIKKLYKVYILMQVSALSITKQYTVPPETKEYTYCPLVFKNSLRTLYVFCTIQNT
jgi:hypothetical protein